jgi:hypothetical protein
VDEQEGNLRTEIFEISRRASSHVEKYFNKVRLAHELNGSCEIRKVKVEEIPGGCWPRVLYSST